MGESEGPASVTYLPWGGLLASPAETLNLTPGLRRRGDILQLTRCSVITVDGLQYCCSILAQSDTDGPDEQSRFKLPQRICSSSLMMVTLKYRAPRLSDLYSRIALPLAEPRPGNPCIGRLILPLL